MPKSKEALLKENASYKKELQTEVDHAQDEVLKIVRNALIAGGLALTVNLLQRAFFSENEEKKVYKSPSESSSFLTNEFTEKATLELLDFASKRLENFLAEVEKDEK